MSGSIDCSGFLAIRPGRLGAPLLASASDPIGVHSSAALELTDSEKIEGLMQKTAALARDVSDLKAQNEALRHEWSERLTDARRDIEVTFQQALTAKLEEYRSHSRRR
jgi:hypothetical protein